MYGGNSNCNFRSSHLGSLVEWDAKLDVGTKGGATLIIEDDLFIVATYNFAKNRHYEYVLNPDTGETINTLILSGKKVGVMVFNKTYVTFTQEAPDDYWSAVAYSLPDFKLIWKQDVDIIPKNWAVDVGFVLTNNIIVAQFYDPVSQIAKFISVTYKSTVANDLFPNDIMMYNPSMISVFDNNVLIRNLTELLTVNPVNGKVLWRVRYIASTFNSTMGAIPTSSNVMFVPTDGHMVMKVNDGAAEWTSIFDGICSNLALSDDGSKLFTACSNPDGQSTHSGLTIIDTSVGSSVFFPVPQSDNDVYCAFNAYKNPKTIVTPYSNPGGVVLKNQEVFLLCDKKAYLFQADQYSFWEVKDSFGFEEGFTDALLSPIGDSSNCVYYCLNPPSLDLMMTCHKKCYS